MRIVIVEDGARSREGLRRAIGIISKTYKIVGEAESGVIGLELIKKVRPDLVIIDICMSKMDGLEMLDLLKKSGIMCKVVLISAYSEFTFAQKAIRLGVDDYLLKPITVEELSKVLKNIEERLSKDREALNYPESLESLGNILNSILVAGIEADTQLCNFLRSRYAIDADDEFIMVPVYLGRQYELLNENFAAKLKDSLQHLPDGSFCILKLPQNKQLLIILYTFDDPEMLERWFEQTVLNQYQEKDNGVVFGWICFKRLSEMRNSLQLIQKCMDWSIVLSTNAIISHEKTSELSADPLNYPIEIENQMCNAICTADEDRIRRAIKDFQALFNQGKIYLPQNIKEVYKRFLLSVINLVKEIDFVKYNTLKNLIEKTNDAITLHELEDLLANLLTVLLHDDKKNELTVSLMVQRTRSLAQEFYPTGITLDEIASKLDVSPEYLSTQFRKEMGTNFNMYIKGLRIDMAKELLIGTELKVYQIAERIGYSSPKYFSNIFKEVTGKLPVEYRKLHK